MYQLRKVLIYTFVMLHYRMTWVRSFNPFKIEISVKDLQNVLRVNLYMTLKCFDMAVRLLAIKESHMSKDEMIKDKNIIWTCASG